MDHLIIEKTAMKFTIEVVAKNNELTFNVVRYIDVGKDECMETNAKFAKSDALKINGHYVNCNTLMKSALQGMEANLLAATLDVKKQMKIQLKKSCTFGY